MKLKVQARAKFSKSLEINKKALALCLALFVNRLGAMTKMFFPIYLVGEVNFTIAEASQLMSLYGAGLLGGALLLGYVADLIPPKSIAVAAFIGSAITLGLLGVVDDRALLKLILAGAGIFDSGANVLGQRLLLETTGEHERMPAQALIRVGNNLGAALAGVLCGILATYSFKSVFFLDAICSLLAALIVHLSIHLEKKNKTKKHHAPAGVMSPTKDIPFIVFEIGVVFVAMAYHALYFALGNYVIQKYNGSTSSFGIQFSINSAMIVLLQLPVSRRLAGLLAVKTVLTGSGLLIAGFFLLFAGETVFQLTISTVFWTLGEIVLFPYINVQIMKRATGRRSGQYFGTAAAAWNSAAFTTPLCIAAVTLAWGMNAVWIFCIAAIVIAAGLLITGAYAFESIKHQPAKNA